MPDRDEASPHPCQVDLQLCPTARICLIPTTHASAKHEDSAGLDGQQQAIDKAPKSAAVRPVAFPDEILPDVIEHLERYAGAGRDGHVSLGPQGGQLRRSNLRDDWIKARKDAGIAADVHFHDLRHTGNNLVAATASTRELMTRMGHSTARAALICQHMTADGDRAIADRLGAMIRKQQGNTGT
ncbi:tyrosine-type recombinase/integrase [Streptomyces sp. NPDC005795]|uniref:tyrosine-type recombinase/integrase n=1 Tax=Streptomyces sp. NPDC005795 TaxID=3154677 RepID=UPI00340B6EDC